MTGIQSATVSAQIILAGLYLSYLLYFLFIQHCNLRKGGKLA